MPSINADLLDKIMRFQIDLRRMEAGSKKKVVKILESLQKDLIAEISGQEILGLSKANLKKLLRAISEILIDHYAQAESTTRDDIDGLSKLEVKRAIKSLKETVFIGVAVNAPSDTLIDRLTRDVMINGGPLASWWQRQREDTQFKIGNALRQGILQAETNQQILERIIGKKTEPGIMTVAGRNALALVQTATHTIVNDARQSVYEANDDVIKSLVHFSTLDSHTSIQCIGRSGKEWKNDKNHTPIGHSLPFIVPPVHINCRSVLLPKTLTFEEMGIDLPETPVGTRASSLGQLDGDITFDQYFKMIPKAQQDEMLGIGKAQMWRDKKITLSDLLDQAGRELSLEDLKKKYN